MFPTLPNRTDCFCGSGSKSRDPESGSISHYINPITCDVPFISQFKDDRNTSRASDRSNEAFLFFIEFNFLLYLIFKRHQRQQNPAPAQPASPSPPPPRRRRKPQNPRVMPWILQREERGCCKTPLDELIITDIPGYRNFTRMAPAFCDLIYLFIWGFTSLSTLYRSYHDG